MTVEESHGNLAGRLSVTESPSFSYDELDNETRLLVGQRTSEIKNLIHRSAQDIFDIGQKLIEVKEKLGHGRFLIWLNTEFGWSQSAARRFMQVARQFKMTNFTDLNIATSALYLLASNTTSFAARQKALERATRGEIINYSEAKSIIAQHKEIGKRSLLPTQITVDVPAEIVDVGLLSQNLDKQTLKYLHPLPVEAVKTYTKFIDTLEDMDFQLLESMEDEALKVLINKSKLLAKRAKILLAHRWQSSEFS